MQKSTRQSIRFSDPGSLGPLAYSTQMFVDAVRVPHDNVTESVQNQQPSRTFSDPLLGHMVAQWKFR